MSNPFVSHGLTTFTAVNEGVEFTGSNTVSASGNTIGESLETLYHTSKKTTDELLNNMNSINPPKITDYKVTIKEILMNEENHAHTNAITPINEQEKLQSLTKDDYYYTYYNKEYILYEPTRYLNDVFSVSFNFWFSKEETIYPYFYFVKDNITYEKKLNKQHTKIDNFINITFGPFQKIVEENRPEEVYIAIKTNTNIIFFKHHKLLNYNDYTFKKEYRNNPINLNFMIASCFTLPGYRDPAPLEPELYNKFTETARETNSNFIISTGDVVYLDNLNVTSEIACQSAYTQLREYPRLQGTFSNYTWIACNDDHEFSVNDGNKNGAIIKILRDTYSKNFPLLSQVSDEYRANITIMKDITFIILDSVSCRILNPNPIGNDIFLQILGPSQLRFLLDGLSNVYSNFGKNALCFIVFGKSMFGDQSETTLLYCPQERIQILNHIKFLGLRNVCFLCGDSHFSDVSQYTVNEIDNQIIREIRCSAIGSFPRTGDNNKYRVEGSLVIKNNYGRINVEGANKDYKISYTDYTMDGSVYNYKWNTNY